MVHCIFVISGHCHELVDTEVSPRRASKPLGGLFLNELRIAVAAVKSHLQEPKNEQVTEWSWETLAVLHSPYHKRSPLQTTPLQEKIQLAASSSNAGGWIVLDCMLPLDRVH